jgi:hypothetical protein
MAPKAAHAIAATLVQVTNTASNPAIAQSPNSQAAQLIQLTSNYTTPGNFNYLFTDPLSGHPGQQPYTVPGSQNLVITSIDITPDLNCGSPTSVTLGGVSTRTWVVASQAMTHLPYPSGIVVGPGISLSVFVPQVGQACAVTVDLNGYLTAN